MRKKLSVRDRVLRVINNSYPVKPKFVIDEIKAPPNQIYTAIYKLVQAGYVRKDANSYLSPIDVDVVEPAKVTTRKATGMEMELGRKTAKLEAEIERLQNELQNTTIKYFDTLAVVKYYESKIGLAVK